MNSINFFADQAQTTLDKFINWSLSYGRVIVMVTELIALLAFLYRFGLDRQLSDLHDSIKQQQTIVAASKPAEDNFRNLQTRLALVKQYIMSSQTSMQYIFAAIDQSKGNVQFTTFNYATTGIHMSLSADSTGGLNAFVARLRDLQFVDTVAIESIQSKESTHLITATLGITFTAQGGGH